MTIATSSMPPPPPPYCSGIASAGRPSWSDICRQVASSYPVGESISRRTSAEGAFASTNPRTERRKASCSSSRIRFTARSLLVRLAEVELDVGPVVGGLGEALDGPAAVGGDPVDDRPRLEQVYA